MKLSEYLVHELRARRRTYADSYELMFTIFGSINERQIDNKQVVAEALRAMLRNITSDISDKIDRVLNTEWEEEK